ncbi:IS1595 family transposase [Burkholderia cepacia]|uniref:IS1595 family transposase n=1 Tax=Burkholderia cepacia TaxID=292 RepID=UPI00234910D2|nr:IS1595 family transposase [Burkholderia cepacia]MDC6101950.1 IS1595 family transposase [Burkholderia cepacia]
MFKPRPLLSLWASIRECLLLQADNDILEGVVEADGGHFCGKPRKGRVRFKTTAGDIEAKLTAKLNGEKAPRRKPRSKAEARNWARRQLRRIVMVVRETAMPGSGASKTRIAIGYAENAKVAEAVMREMVKPGSVLVTDENAAYIPLAAFYDHKSVQHSVEFSTDDGINENQAESFFSRMRRAEYGTYHGFRPKYLHDYAQEFAWREDTRRMTENEKLVDLSSRIFGNGLSRWWRGYWQGFHRPGEYKLYG